MPYQYVREPLTAEVAFVRRVLISDLQGPVGERTEVGTTAGIVEVQELVAEVVAELQ